MTPLKIFLAISAGWLLFFFAFLNLFIGETATISAAITAVTYVCPFGGLWCAFATSYFR